MTAHIPIAGAALADEQRCHKVLDPKEVRERVRRDRWSEVQSALEKRYLEKNDDYKRDYEGRSHLVSDGKFGPVTLKWLRQFCVDVRLDEREDLTPKLVVDALLGIPLPPIHSDVKKPGGDRDQFFTVYMIDESDLKEMKEVTGQSPQDTVKSKESVATQSPQEIVKPKEQVAGQSPKKIDISKKIMNKLEKIKGIEFPTRWQFESAICGTRENPDGKCRAEAVQAVLGKARKSIPIKEISAKNVSWSTATVACEPQEKQDQPEVTENEVYAFYPFWRSAGDEDFPPKIDPTVDEDLPPKIDPTVLTRMAYFPIFFNEKGGIESRWKTENDRYVSQLERYGVKADLVLYRGSWDDLDLSALSENRIENLADRIANDSVKEAKKKLKDGWSRVKRYVPFFGVDSIRGDGITVFIENYAPAADSLEPKFKIFFDALITGLITAIIKESKPNEPKPNVLSIVTRQDLLPEKGPLGYETLLGYRHKAKDAGIDMRFLVLLPVPKLDSRSRVGLWRALDEGYQEAEASPGDWAEFLRAVIPILVVGTEGEQMSRDMRHSTWLYGGVGFWPTPFVDDVIDGAEKKIYEAWKQNQHLCAPDIGEKIQGMLRPYIWHLRIVFLLTVFFSAVSWLIYFVSCRLPRLRGLPAFPHLVAIWLFLLLPVALFVALFIVLLYNDPVLEKLSEGNLPLMVALGSVALYAFYLLFLRGPDVAKP